jgi:prephenate dehydratase/prolyl-tRNA editing enzyme YbaK/EbsC (Cys-tRNA(Pro) deacylase)
MGLISLPEKTVAYLGPAGTYSHMVALAAFGPVDERGFRYRPESELSAVVRSVAEGAAIWGVVPYFNTLGGPLRTTHPALLDFAHSEFASLVVFATVSWRVRHSLLGRGPLGRIRRVYSKHEVFTQVPRWLRTHLPHATIEECDSTAAAVRRAEREGEAAAAIASPDLLVFHQNMTELAGDIQDADPNITQFLVLRRREEKKRRLQSNLPQHTWITFTSSLATGSLQKMLGAAERWGIAAAAISGAVVSPADFEMRFLLELALPPSAHQVRFMLSETAHLMPMVIGAPFEAHHDLAGLRHLVEQYPEVGGDDRATALAHLPDQVKSLLDSMPAYWLYVHAPVSDMESVWGILGVPPEKMLNTQVLQEVSSHRLVFSCVLGSMRVDEAKVSQLLATECRRVSAADLIQLGQVPGAESPLTAPTGAKIVIDQSVAAVQGALFLGSGHACISVVLPSRDSWQTPVRWGDIAVRGV